MHSSDEELERETEVKWNFVQAHREWFRGWKARRSITLFIWVTRQPAKGSLDYIQKRKKIWKKSASERLTIYVLRTREKREKQLKLIEKYVTSWYVENL